MVATAEEIGSAMEIQSISWQRGTSGFSSSGTYNDLRIYLGYSSEDMLSTSFSNNYTPLSRTMVYQNDAGTISAEENEWFELVLDTPFWYNGVDNLILEISWESGTGNPSVYHFDTPMTPVSLKSADPSGDQGFLSSTRSMFMLSGSQDLSPSTFGSVKVILGK